MNNSIITNCFKVVKYGFNFVAFNKSEKRAVTEWKQFQHEAQTEEHHNQQLQLLKNRKADTIALIGGFNGLIALDFDAIDKTVKPIPDSVPQEIAKMLNLPWPYQWSWRSVSGAGWHIWIVVPDLPSDVSLKIISSEKLKSIGITDTSHVRALEVRAWRLCTAIPPHVSIPDNPPLSVSWKTIKELFHFEERSHAQQQYQFRHITHKDKRYADAVFKKAIEAIRNAAEGERNTTLYYQARELFRFCIANALDEQTVIDALNEASTLRNDAKEERERVATINSARKNAARLGPRYAPDSDSGVAMSTESHKQYSCIELLEKELSDEGYNFYLNMENGDYLIQYNDSPLRRVEDHDVAILKRLAKIRNYPLYAIDLAIAGIADRNKKFPIRDGLLSLKWDGEQHIAKVASCLHVSDDVSQEIAEKWLTYWLLKAVGRVFAQEQNVVLVLEGGQGIGKSHFVQWLGSVFQNSYIEEHVDPHSKDCLLNLTRHLVWEICELETTTRKHDAAALKHFITRSTVTIRPPYGRTTITRPVLASLIATTNNPVSGYLTDETGNRRFLILPISHINWNYTKIDPKQVWAEAVHRWQHGERGVLSKEDIHLRESVASERMMTSLLDVWLKRYVVITHNKNDVLTSADIVEFLEKKSLKLGGNERSQATAVGTALARLGVQKERRLLSNGMRVRVWVGVTLNDTKSNYVHDQDNNDSDDNNDNPPNNEPPKPPNGGGGGGGALNIEETATWEEATMHTLETVDDVNQALRRIMSSPSCGFDIETTGLDPRNDNIRLVSLATHRDVYVLDAFKTDVRLLKPLFDNEQGPVLTGHNLKFDLSFMRRAGIDAPTGARLFDTWIAAKLLSAGENNVRHSLDHVSHRYLKENIDKTLQKSNWSGELTQQQLEYAARDAHVVWRLRNTLMNELTTAKLTTVSAIENKALPSVVWMEDHGVLIDTVAWNTHATTLSTELRNIEEDLVNKSNKVINWRSTQQVLKLLRERGHNITNTDDDTLKPLVSKDELITLLLRHREVSKKYSAFGHSFLEYVSSDKRIHPDFDQLGAVSGRMTCRKPNLQQIPRDPTYRSFFIAPDGRVLIKADYSQIELRIAAEITNDERMLEAYSLGEDLHTLTAKLVLGKKEVTKADRQAAKALNFGLIYGMGAERLRLYAANSYNVQLTDEQAVHFRNKFFDTYRGIKEWHYSKTQGIEEVRTLSGRRRLNVERFQEKLNTPVQGTGADGLKAALGLLWDTRILRHSAIPILAVHDEIVVECDESDAEAVKEWVVSCMVQGMKQFLTKVPVEVEAVITKNWGGK